MTVHLEPGRFYAGVSLPFFITHSMVESQMTAYGLTNIHWFDRKDAASLAVNIAKYPGASDDWSEWVEADYAGPKKDLSIAKNWAWLLVVPAKASPSTLPPNGVTARGVSPEASQVTGETAGWGLVSLGVTLFGMLWSRSK